MSGEVLSPMAVQWLVGLGAASAFLLGLLHTAKICRDLFGRKPALNEELDKRETALRLDWDKRESMLRMEMSQFRMNLDQQKQQVDQRFADLELQRSRSLGELHEKINKVVKAVARIQGRLRIPVQEEET
jgi:hypothetical protein